MTDSADLLRRAEEVALFRRRIDPYTDPDMTYPPTAPPIFTVLVAPFRGWALKAFWLGLNLAALAALCGGIVRLGAGGWPGWLRAAFCLAVAASKPARGGIGLGQFHLIPTALAVLAIGTRSEVAAGLMMGIALVKPTIALPFLALLAARRRWRALAVALGLQAVLLAGDSAWLSIGPLRLIREWLALARLQVPAGSIDLPTLAHRAWPGVPALGAAIPLVVLTLACAGTVAWRHRSDLALAGVSGAAAAIFTYHRFYDLVLLVPALAFLIDVAHRDRGPLAVAAGVGAAVFAAVLIVPEQPFEWVGLGRVYETAFVGLTYLLLGLALGLVASRRPGGHS